MNHWKDDEARRRSHHRGVWRRIKSTARTLMVVLGWLALILALLLAAATWGRAQDVQHRLFVMSGGYAAGGATLILLHYIFFILPETIRARRSESGQRRRRSRRGHSHDLPELAASPLASADAARSAPAGKQGLALVFVLVMLALIATLVIESQITARSLLRRSESTQAQSALRRAAGDAIRAALQRLADDDDLRVDFTNEACFAAEDLTTPDGIDTHVVVVDENRYFDVNNLAAKNVPPRRLPADILADLLTLCGDFSPSAYVNALTDWVDADGEGVAESELYLKRAPPYRCVNRCMYDWSEMLAADGARREMFDHHPRTSTLDTFNADVVNCITVCPLARERPLPLNVNTATKESLQGVLGIGQDDMIKTILALRSLKPIRSLDSVLAVSDPDVVEMIRPYLDVRSRVFRVDARAYANNRAVNVRALAQRDSSGQVNILQWIF